MLSSNLFILLIILLIVVCLLLRYDIIIQPKNYEKKNLE